MRRLDLLAHIGQVFRTIAADTQRCERFRVVVFSVQPDHLHLIVEAFDKLALTNGMRGLSIRLARAVTGCWVGPVQSSPSDTTSTF
jgi:REP element-mobilizing transposase RayT